MRSQLTLIALIAIVYGVAASREFMNTKSGTDFEVVGNNANYLAWDDENVLPKLSQGCIHFSVKGKSDAHILLSPVRDVPRYANSYEIVLGGWGNTKSVIRHGTQGTELDSYPKNWRSDKKILSETEVRPFWISIADGEISVGKGKICYRHPIMTQTFSKLIHPDRLISNLKYVAFAGWNSPVSFTNVEIDETKSDMMQFMTPGNGGKYRVFNYPNVIRVSTENFEMVFAARGDAGLIALLPGLPGDTSAVADAIEIHLDAKNGTKSQIWHGTEASGKGKLLYETPSHDMVVPDKYNNFWIRKYGVGLALGTGVKVGQNVFLNTAIHWELNVEKFTVGWAAKDYPTTYIMMSHKDLEVMDEDDVQANLDEYFDKMTEVGMETEMYTKGKKFNKKLYEEWQLATGEKNLDSEDQDAWEDLQYKLAARGDPYAISIMRGTAPKPTMRKLSKEEWENAEY